MKAIEPYSLLFLSNNGIFHGKIKKKCFFDDILNF